MLPGRTNLSGPSFFLRRGLLRQHTPYIQRYVALLLSLPMPFSHFPFLSFENKIRASCRTGHPRLAHNGSSVFEISAQCGIGLHCDNISHLFGHLATVLCIPISICFLFIFLTSPSTVICGLACCIYLPLTVSSCPFSSG